jgi:hypothetical protein
VTGHAEIQDPDLRAFEAKLRLVTQGPLFDMERMRALVGLNLGWWDHLLPPPPSQPTDP